MNDFSPTFVTSDVRQAGDQRADNAASSSSREGVLAPVQSSESILRHYWRVVLKRRWVILAVTVLALLGGLVMALMSQPLYSATVTLEIARERARVVEMDDVQPRLGADQEFYQTQYALLKSRSLAEMVVRDLRLANDPAFLTDYQDDAAEATTRLPREQRERIAVGKVMANLDVIPVRLSSVVNVRYISPNPQMAANIANSIGENFIEQNLARRFESSAYARQFLETRLGQMRQRLEDSERQATGYAAQQQIINIAPLSRNPETPQQEQSLVAADLGASNGSLAEARAVRIAAEARYRRAQGGTAAQEGLQNQVVNGLRQQRATLSAELERQSSSFGPEYPAVVALRAQIREIEESIARETARIRSSVSENLRAQYEQALSAEQQLAGRVETLKADMIDLRRRSIQYNILQREVDTNRTLYDALLQRYREVGISGSVGTNNVSIVDRAPVPPGPFSPNMPLTVLLSLIIGVALGVGVAVVLEQLDEATIDPSDFQSKLGISLLGAVPKLGKGETVQEALGDRKAPLSEAYLSVLTGLQYSTAHGMPKSILVTSTQAAEGKSTTAFALAQSLARVGARVLLIDADMRNPSLHKSLDLPNKVGLSSLLVGDGKLSDLMQKTRTENLVALTAGHLPPNPAELLSGTRMREVIGQALGEFDHVVVDGPPILGLADAPLLAKATESTVFVMEANRTRSTQARHAISRIAAVQAVVAGAVLAKFDQQKAGYGYGYGYDYAYGH